MNIDEELLKTKYKEKIGTLLSGNLREIRKSINFSQQDMANAINKPFRTVQNWESGKVIPPGDALPLYEAVKEMAKAYDSMDSFKKAIKFGVNLGRDMTEIIINMMKG
jgi:DNA-binding transcriptional regulator YiaG